MDTPYWHRSIAPALRAGPRPDLSRILPCLVVGEYVIPEDVEWLRDEHGIAGVLCLQDDPDLAGKRLDLRALRLAYDAAKVRFHHVPIPDGDIQVMAARLDATVALVDEFVCRGESIYVHCNAGLNRAPTVAAAYLHVHEGLALAAACDFVKTRRACVPYLNALKLRYGAA